MPPPRRPAASAAAVALLLLTTAVMLVGCGGPGRREVPRPAESAVPRQDAAGARAQNRAALDALAEGKTAEAARRLRAATAADPTYGPAHNNLGKLYYQDADLYRAAGEFQLAAKLMPEQPEPANNLGLVLESAGKFDEAVAQYERAVALAPDGPQYVGNLARARVRRGQGAGDATTRRLLERLVLVDDRPAWLEWARRQLSRAGATQPSETALPSGVPYADPGHYP